MLVLAKKITRILRQDHDANAELPLELIVALNTIEKELNELRLVVHRLQSREDA